MASTPNFSFTLPTIGGDQNTWGNELNGNWTHLDTVLQGIVAPPAGPTYLLLTGGTMTGPLVLSGDPTSQYMPVTLHYLQTQGYVQSGSSMTLNNLTLTGAAAVTGNVQLGSLSFTGHTDWQMYVTGTQRVLQWASTVSDIYDTNSFIRSFVIGSINRVQIDSSGDLSVQTKGYQPGGGTWGASSDDRVKRDVAPYTAGLEQIMQLRPIAFSYNGKGDTTDDGKTYYGVSAQATQPVMPELVAEMAPRAGRLKGQLATHLGPLTLALCNAVRQLSDRIAALEERHG